MSITTLGFGFHGGGGGGSGTPGPPGTPGSVWRNNSGPPSNSLGINGDYYLNNDNGFVYQKVSNAYQQVAVIKGANGTNGTNGSVWYAGTGAPVSSPSYNANDFYLNNDNGDVFRYDGVTWQPETNIDGTDGTNGSVWYAGTGAPIDDPLIYNQNDFYLDNDNGQVYQFNGTNWNPQVNIKGANGSQWFTASGVPTVIQNDGDFYLNAADGEVWQQILGSWVDTGTNIKGANGINGTDGSIWYSGAVFPPTSPPTYNPNDFFLDTTNGNVYQYDGTTWQPQLTLSGVAGASWFNGNGAPTVIENDGDYYLDDLTGDVYTQVSGAWSGPVANIKGPAGAPGAKGQDGSSSSYFFYRTKDTLTSGDPLPPHIRWNDVTPQISATELGISKETEDAVDISIFLALLQVGDTIVIQDKDVAANFQTWEVSGAITDYPTWVSVPVTLVTSGGTGTSNFANNLEVIVAISREGTAGADGANSTRYGFDSASVSPTPPAANRFNADDTDVTNIARLCVDNFNFNGIDFYNWWDYLRVNYIKSVNDSCILQIREIGNTSIIASYNIQQVLDVGTYFDLKLVFLSGSGTLDPTKVYSLSYSLAGIIGGRGVSGPNSVEWLLNTSALNGEFSYLPVIGTLASTITSFILNDTASYAGNQFDWLEYARTTAISGAVGILSVTPTEIPQAQANFEILSVVDNTGSHTINVSFLGGADFDFSAISPATTYFTFSYVFNGVGGGGAIGVYYPDISTPIDLATNTMVFTGGGVTVTQTSPSDVEINIPTAGTFGAIVASIRSLSTSTTLSPFTVGNMTIPYNGTITG